MTSSRAVVAVSRRGLQVQADEEGVEVGIVARGGELHQILVVRHAGLVREDHAAAGGELQRSSAFTFRRSALFSAPEREATGPPGDTE
jgi:hypothetical protein